MNYRRTTQPFFAIAAAAVSLVPSAPAQSKVCTWPELKPSPLNLNFSQGNVGSAPTGWLLGPEWFMPPHVPAYEALIAAANQCHGSPQCALCIRCEMIILSRSLFFIRTSTPRPTVAKLSYIERSCGLTRLSRALRGCLCGFIGKIAQRHSAMTWETVRWCLANGVLTKSGLR